MKTPYDVIMLGMSTTEEWASGIHNRNRQVLQELLNHPEVNSVLLVDYLPWTWKRTVKYCLYRLFSNQPKINHPKLFHYRPLASWFSEQLVYKKINRLTKRHGFKNIILWSYLPTFVNYETITKELTVFDMVDDWSVHPAYRKIKDRLTANYRKLAKTADIVFTVAKQTYSYFSDHHNVHWIPNGVDFNLFSKDLPCPLPLLKLPRPVIGYSGTIQDRFNQELLYEAAIRHSDWSFVLVGWVWPSARINKLKPLPNVYFVGRQPYDQVPAWIKQFAVAVIPHTVDRFLESTDPMKLYEYLAIGRPVVATSSVSLEPWQQFVYLADDPLRFLEKIELALKEDSVEKWRLRQQAVMTAGWSKRVEEMLRLIAASKGF